MITYEQAFALASARCELPVVSASRLTDGWVFGFAQPLDRLGVSVPGGPKPVAVYENGTVRTLLVPLDEAFAVLDSVIERGLPLPEMDS